MATDQDKGIQMVDNFSFRNGETLCVQDRDLTDCRYALMFATVKPLPGDPKQRSDGMSVEPCVVCAAERTEDGWQWMHLSSQAKEVLIDTYLDELHRDVWHGMIVGEVRHGN